MSRFVIPTLSLLIAIALFFSMIQPGFDRIRTTERELTEYRKAVENAEKLRVRVDELVAERERISPDDFERLEAILPDSIDPVRMTLLLDTIAGRNQMGADGIKVEAASASAGESEALFADIDPDTGESMEVVQDVRGQQFSRATASFSVSGDYEEFRQLLYDLEQSLVLMDIVGLTITAAGASSEDGSGASSESEGGATYAVTVHLYEYEP